MLENSGYRFTASRKITTLTTMKRIDMPTRTVVRIRLDPVCLWDIYKEKFFLILRWLTWYKMIFACVHLHQQTKLWPALSWTAAFRLMPFSWRIRWFAPAVFPQHVGLQLSVSPCADAAIIVVLSQQAWQRPKVQPEKTTFFMNYWPSFVIHPYCPSIWKMSVASLSFCLLMNNSQ